MGHRKTEKRIGNKSAANSKSRMNAVWTSLELGLAAIGVLLVVLGALVGTHWEEQIDKKFQEEMVLSADSEGSTEWLSPTLPITTKIYFWNWTNVDDVGAVGYKPVLDEIGPYTFREKHYKENVTWNNNGTVTYRLRKYWYFAPELSAGNLTDNITSINVPAASLSAMTINANFFLRRAFSMALVTARQKISWTKTVGEFLFDGFSNSIIEISRQFDSDVKDKFGFFYDTNGTLSPDVYTMNTGANDIYKIGQIEAFNYKNSSETHEGSCSELRGSLGELWTPHMTSDTVLTMFTPDMCRYNNYYYETESIHNGIPSLVFSSNSKTMDNGSLVEENECFCDTEGCMPSGLYDLRSCRKRAPIFMSLPHLYLADPVYSNAVVGMNPQHDKHKFLLEFEPRTGVPLNIAARLQLNVQVVKNTGITIFRNVEDFLMPVWWMETVVAMPETHTWRVNLLLWIILLGPFIAGLIIFIGLCLILFLLLRRYCSHDCCKRKKVKFDIEGEKSSFALINRIDPPSQSTTDAAECLESAQRSQNLKPKKTTTK